ncbi:MAG: sulfatase [Kiritimatiellales bacterium]
MNYQNLLFTGTILFSVGVQSAALPPKPKPNILFIVVDDLGWRDADVMNEIDCPYRTPNLKKLAAQGMVFTDAYSAAPVCSPTRASLLTGKSPAALRLTMHIPGNVEYAAGLVPETAAVLPPESSFVLPLEEITFAELLKADGYSTAFFGKWHLAGSNIMRHPELRGVIAPEFHPEHQGFDINIGGCAYGLPPSYVAPYKNATLPDGPDGEYLTDRLTDEVIRFISRKQQNPFIVYLNYYAVHLPFQPKPELIDSSYGDKADYAAMIAGVDQNIGRLMAALDELSLTENTIVIFTSDNGGLEGNSPLRGNKGDLWEGGIRVPQIIRWPGVIRADSICREPVISYDFLPTLLGITASKQKIPAGVEGENLLPILREQTGFVRRNPLAWHFPHFRHADGPMGAILRDRNYKLIYSYETGATQLYNLADDLSERNDLSGELPEKTEQLKTKLFHWLQRVNAAMPERKPEDVK